MSNDIKFVLTDAQLAAMLLLNEEDATSFINGAVQSKLIAALTYNKKKIEDNAKEDYDRIKGYLAATGMKMPEDFGTYKARVLGEVQNALNELGYKPNKKKSEGEEEEAQ